MKPARFPLHLYDDVRGNRVEYSEEAPLGGFQRKGSPHDDIIDDELVDVLVHNDDVYRVFWNRNLFSSQEQLKVITQAEHILGLIYINDDPAPMVVRREPTGPNTVGFVGYRDDGKAIIAGTGVVYDEHAECTADPVYGRVRFNCLCGAQKKLTRPPKAGPDPIT